MPRKKPGLGRGLDVLLSAGTDKPVKVVDDSNSASDGLRQLPVEQIQRGVYQPRVRMDQGALEELAASITAQGIVQPLLVRPVGTKFELIAGERRWRAAQIAGLHEVPVVVKPLDDESAAAMALIENIQREDLSPVEEAQALKRLSDEFGLTHEDLAKSVGRSRSAVTNLLRLLELSEVAREFLDSGEIEMGHARALLGVSGSQQDKAARYVVSRGLSVRETEQYVKRLKSGVSPKNSGGRRESSASADIVSLENSLSDTLGAPVSIAHSARGSGKLTIRYTSLDELDGILAHIK